MKKQIITTIAISATLVAVSAQDYGSQEKKMPKPMQAKLMATTTPTGMPKKELQNRAAPVKKEMAEMPKMEIPKTGDEVLDKQLVALFNEREEKIKALRQEYEVKIKAILGDKKIINKDNMMAPGARPTIDEMKKKMETAGGMMASGTRPSIDDMKKKMEEARGQMMNASGSRPMPPKPFEGDRPKPVSLFEGYVKSFFGGNPKQAVAEEVQQ
jgi:hypothetical protein